MKRELLKEDQLTYLDGGMGTMLQARGLKPGERPEEFGMQHPEVVEEVHRLYLEAGSNILYANTFGANPRKLKCASISTADAVKNAIRIARRAVEKYETEEATKLAGRTKLAGMTEPAGRTEPAGSKKSAGRKEVEEEDKIRQPHAVALDVGPIGELLEPLGTVTFEDAYEAYAETMKAGAEAGADLVVIETFTDLQDARAAVLAAKENTNLPVWVTMTFEESGRTFTGTTISAFAMTMEALGVEAVGINCSLGPNEILPLIQEMAEWTRLPLIVKPNAGLPDPATGEYHLKASDFADQMLPFAKLPVYVMGGCCGTNPDYIRELVKSTINIEPPMPNKEVRRGICSPTKTCEFGGVRVIGERLNPTGKKKFQKALLEHDMAYILNVALEEEEAGADVLDVNVGVPGGDEKELMVEVLRALLGVVSLPLQIDSRDPETVEAALRIYPGRALVNSINADDKTLDRLLPVLKKYGAATVALCLSDEEGIPPTAEGRVRMAEHILERTDAIGIPRDDLLMDCLTLTVSAQQDQARETLRALRTVTEEFGVHATLGVSNISFGLPARMHITENFLIQAMTCGLDFPIVNPNQLSIMDAVASFKVLSGEDESCNAYIERFSNRVETSQVTIDIASGAAGTGSKTAGTGAGAAGSAAGSASKFGDPGTIRYSVIKGLKEETRAIAEARLDQMSEEDLINQELIPALDQVGELYEKGILFLPQLISAANAATAAFDMIRDRIAKKGDGSQVDRGSIVICTVKGDVHDIGKNIVRVVLENYGYHMIDLGRDVPVETVVDCVVKNKIKLVGLSALMTTTLPAMKETIDAIKAVSPETKIMVGGAVLTPEYAEEMGADFYSRDAKDGVEIAKKVFGK